jgi:hypothetical protein
VAEALAQAGDRARAQEVFTEAFQAARQIENAYMRSEALGAVANELAQAGQAEQALQVAWQIENAYERFQRVACGSGGVGEGKASRTGVAGSAAD